MTVKRVFRRHVPSQPNKAISTQVLTDDAVVKVLESAGTTCGGVTSVDPESRRHLVAAAAYFIAESRGFAPGHELEDWVAAEAVVDSQLKQVQAA
jgi:hypothetical protein